jgi:hypothetical protein
MITEEQPQFPAIAILAQQVWETLNLSQQQAVLKTVVSLCQGMIEDQEQKARNEYPPDR